MFHTEDSAELSLPPNFAPPGIRSWCWLELTSDKPYYWVAYETCGSGMKFQFMFPDIRQTLQFLTEMSERIATVQLYVISPSGMNHSDQIQMNAISEIWKTTKNDEFLIVTNIGKKYYGNYFSSESSSIETERVWRA
ncbi:hypothetical protein [Ferriphaselus amnicola]|nr:hypothetical protein [Ferriphaselus amnicola]